MRKFSVVLFALSLSMSSLAAEEDPLPSCELARRSPQEQFAASVVVLREIGKVYLEADSIKKASLELSEEVKSGRLAEDSARAFASAYLARIQVLVRRADELLRLGNCIQRRD